MRTADIQSLGSAGFFFLDGFLEDDFVHALHDEADALHQAGRLRPAAVGQGAQRAHERTLRSDQTIWLDPAGDTLFGALHARFEALGRELSEEAYLGLSGFDLQLSRYGPGGGYARHRDAFQGDSSRRATAIVYLNPTWSPADGGLLRLHLNPEPQDVEPRPGRLLIMLSDRIEHEVLPTQAPRFAVTAWFRGRAR